MGDGIVDRYQDIAMFEQQGVGFQYQRFGHPRYPQVKTKEFVPGLSIIDYLFNKGTESWL
jgi:hypothetical protein